jgi:hypothetical protein
LIIQVDVPYKNPYEKSVDEMLNKNSELLKTTPDWKQRKTRTTYTSTSILSELWHTMDNAINGINGIHQNDTSITAASGDQLIPKEIRAMLDSCTDKNKIDEMRTDVRNQILSYLKQRKEMYTTLGHEEYIQWKKEYATTRKKEILIGNGWNNHSNDAIAAVLYEQCRIEDNNIDEQARRSLSKSKSNLDGKESTIEQEHVIQQQRSDSATEFAWAVANNELRKLFAGESITLICKKEEEINIYARK